MITEKHFKYLALRVVALSLTDHVPDDEIIGPGDEFAVAIGESELSRISRELADEILQLAEKYKDGERIPG